MSTRLAEPVAFAAGVTAPNRCWLAPMTNQQSHADGTLSDDEHAWLMRRAAFGVVETCAAYIADDGKGWPGELGVASDLHDRGLARLARDITAAGALGLVQIFHGGVRAPQSVTGVVPWSASTWHEDGPDFTDPRTADEPDILRAIAQFGEAAARSRRAGFAGVELHGAHGYLLSQFMSRTMNPRTDGWGATLEGRARLVREATRAARAACPRPFLVGVRLSPEDFGHARGLDLDETLQIASWLAEDGIDFLHVSLWDVARNTAKRPDQHPLPLFRAAVPDHVRLVAAGKIWTRDDAERTLDLGADFVALGRAAIANPDWPRQVLDPNFEPVRPPHPPADLASKAVSPTLIEYLRRWKGFVGD
ncbi:MAG: NADH:flavin oxidoreductase [Myxococcales bacterium]|nr:NADH:flavin oxidoreductase [Myxococcales bacterium]